MNREAAETYVRLWAHQPVPKRPSRLGLDHYRRALERVTDPRVLIYGGTPELADLAVEMRAARVVRIDLSVEILIGMEALATRSWEGIENHCGDWLEPRPQWEGQFDVACCDGGTLFLQFPDQWRALFDQTRHRLVRGGQFVFKSQTHHERAPSCMDLAREKIEGFKRREEGLGRTERLAEFWHLASDLWQASHLGHVDPDGRTRKRAIIDQMERVARLLIEAFDDRELEEIARTELHGLLRNPDGSTMLEYLTPPELVVPELEAAGLRVDELEHLADSRPFPDYCWQITATRVTRP